MLTTTEISGLRTILTDLNDSDLLALADTVTKKLIKTENKNDAIEAILSCLEKPSDLLKRQRVTKRVLFGYLRKIRPVVSPESTKHDLVKMCLTEWNSIEECKESDYTLHSNSFQNESSSSTAFKDPNASALCTPADNTFLSSCDWLIKMGLEFVKWFFPMLNNLQGFGPEHFWSDCRLQGALKTGLELKEVQLSGDKEVATFISGLIMNDRFYFDANYNSESVFCDQDPHGLVRIAISGIVHQFSNCIGLFDWNFGLVRNPAFENWKIRIVQLKIEVTSANRSQIMPTNPCQSLCQGVSIS